MGFFPSAKEISLSAKYRADNSNNNTFAINIKTLIKGLTPSSVEVENKNIPRNKFCYSANVLNFVLRLTLAEAKSIQIIFVTSQKIELSRIARMFCFAP